LIPYYPTPSPKEQRSNTAIFPEIRVRGRSTEGERRGFFDFWDWGMGEEVTSENWKGKSLKRGREWDLGSLGVRDGREGKEVISENWKGRSEPGATGDK
jgi:hypothetical protein